MSLYCSGLTLACRAGASVHLRHDADAAVVVTEVSQLVSHGSAVDTAFVAFFGAVDTAFMALLEQWTFPCGALRKWTSPLRS